MSDYPVPARFYRLPDGSQSTIQMIVGADGEPRPLAVSTPQQLAEWSAIQDARPLTMTERETKVNAAAARPLFGDQAEADAADGGNLLADVRAAAEAQAAVSAVNELDAPQTQAEHDQRAGAAAQLAASLGYRLVYVPVTDGLGNPPHLEVRDGIGTPAMMGDLITIEKALADLARERRQRDAKIAAFNAHRQRLAAEQAERIANLPENRLARLEAKLAAAGIEV